MSWLPPWLSWWDKQALSIQQTVREARLQGPHYDDQEEYTEEKARQATVHTYLSSANRLLASIRFRLFVLIMLTIVLIVIGLKMAMAG